MANATKTKSKGTAVAAKAPPKKVAKAAVAAKSTKPAAKSVVAAKPAKPAAKKPAKSVATRRAHEVPTEQRRNYVEVAAYYIAEGHGFTPGRELADWAEAEAKIDRLLREGLLNP